MQKIIWNIIKSICVIAFVACRQSHQNVNLLSRMERLAESDSSSAIKQLSNIPEQTFSDPYCFKIHNEHCMENVYYSKIICDIEKGHFYKAEELLRQFFRIRNLYNQKYSKVPYNQSDLVGTDFDLEIHKNLILLDFETSINKDSLLLETERQLKQRIYKQQNSHWEKETQYAEYHIFTSKYYYFLLLSVSVVLAILLYSQHKSKEINDLCKKMNKSEDEVKYLNRQFRKYQSDTNLRLGIGKRIFETIRNNGNMKNISVEDEQCFVDYYAFCYPEEYAELRLKYASLSLRHTTYLILRKMEFEDKEIRKILFVQDSTIRNYRARIKRCIKQ